MYEPMVGGRQDYDSVEEVPFMMVGRQDYDSVEEVPFKWWADSIIISILRGGGKVG